MLTTIAIVLINGPNKVVCNILLAIATILIFWEFIQPHIR